MNDDWSYGVYPSKQVLEDLYYKKNLSQREIAKLLQCNPMRVRRAFRKYGLRPRTSREGQLVKDYSDVYYQTDRAELTPSPTLAYLLGVIKGDGSVSIHRSASSQRSRAYKITLGNVEHREFAESFKQALEHIGIKTRIYEYDQHWYVDACSKRFATWCETLTLGEIEGMLKDETLAKEFIRGFYESEGGFAKIWKKVHGYGFWDHRVNISNTDRKLIDLASTLLQKFGFHHRVYSYTPKKKGRKTSHRLWIWGKANTRRFIDLFSPVIKNVPRIWVCKKEW